MGVAVAFSVAILRAPPWRQFLQARQQVMGYVGVGSFLDYYSGGGVG